MAEGETRTESVPTTIFAHGETWVPERRLEELHAAVEEHQVRIGCTGGMNDGQLIAEFIAAGHDLYRAAGLTDDGKEAA